jgi:hypothetical protein
MSDRPEPGDNPVKKLDTVHDILFPWDAQVSDRKYSWVKNSLLCEIFVVEGKMIVVGPFKCPPFSFEKGSRIYPFVQSDEESSAKIPSPAPSPLPVDELAWQILPDKFSARSPIDLAPYRGFALRQSA